MAFGTGGHVLEYDFDPEACRMYREEAGLTQRELMVLAGFSASSSGGMVSLWEQGKITPSHHNVTRLARALGVSRALLLINEGEDE